MRAVAMNNLIALTSPDHPNVFRILFETDPPEVVLGRISVESISPIVIYLTKEVVANPETQSYCINMIDIFCKPVRIGSQWRHIEQKMVDRIFEIHRSALEPPAFLEQMPTDEGRSTSTGSDCKVDDENESEEDTAVVAPPGGINVPPGMKYHAPDRRGYLRNLWEFVPDGARIWHPYSCPQEVTAVKHDGWYGQYNLATNTIVGEADGKKYSNITAFATAHYELHERNRQSGWSECKYWVEGEWRSIGKVKPK